VAALADYLAMGGYAAFVWPAYGAAAIVLVALLVASVRSLARCEAELAQLGGDGERDEA
jgi:heme exporter protein D